MQSHSSRVNDKEGLENAVYIKDLCVSYNDGTEVVKKLRMKVKRRTIYGFLGSSGCGKTTVLSCLVGLKSWDFGDVFLFGKERDSKNSNICSKQLGYMPQDTALYNELSIKEMMQFYGRIYNISNVELNQQRKALFRLLDLSSCGNKLIRNLSGGQKRRASLALALIHSPELLVLDEPTVGLDPVLRENIWNYFTQLVDNQGTTIILTTHYIEEARLANTIGVMRRGRILIEESPSKLLDNYNYCRLEQVVLHICKLDQDQVFWENLDQNNKRICHRRKDIGNKCQKIQLKKHNQQLDIQQKCANDELHERFDDQSFINFLRATLAFAHVIFLVFLRFPFFLILVLCIPAIQGTISLWIIGSKPLGLTLGVVNHETLDCLKDSNSTSGCYFDSESATAISLSCKYLHLLRQDTLLNLKLFESEEEARQHVSLGKSWGIITFPANFSQNFGDLMMARQYSLNGTLQGSRVPIVLDYSQYIPSFFMVKSMMLSFTTFLHEFARECNFDEKSTDFPFKFQNPIYGDTDDNYTTFVMPGVLIFVMFVIGGTMTSLILIDNRKLGIISRATVAGLTWANVVTGHVIVQGILSIVQLAIWNIVMHYFFPIPTLGPTWIYVLICLLIALCGNTSGLFWGIFLNEELDVLLVGLFITNVSITFGGLIWPPETMSRFWQNFGSILPSSLPTAAMRSVILRGVGIEHETVWPGIVVPLLWSFLLISLSRLVYKKGK